MTFPKKFVPVWLNPLVFWTFILLTILQLCLVAWLQLPQQLPVKAFLFQKGQKISLEIATTPKEKAKGLKFRDSLAPDRGMLFIVNPPKPVKLWMYQVNFPLDILYLHEGVIKEINPNTPECPNKPCPIYFSRNTVDHVLELPAGRASELDLKAGDRVYFNFPYQ
jgi:uncharacterized protein